MNILRITVFVFLLSCTNTHQSRFFILKESPHRYGEFSHIAKKIAHLPIQFDKSISKDLQTVLSPVLRKMNVYIDSKNYLSEKMPANLIPSYGEPELYIGIQDINITQRYIEKDPFDKDANQDIILNIKDPSESWMKTVQAELIKSNKSYLLISKLTIRKYWIKEGDFIGKKRIELGLNNYMSVPITMDKHYPVEVLQLQSVLVSADGKVLRVMAEGIAPNYVIEKNKISKVSLKIDKEFAVKIKDLSFLDQRNNALRWEIALGNTIAQLLGRSDLVK